MLLVLLSQQSQSHADVFKCGRPLIGLAGVDMLSWGGGSPQDSLQGLLQVVSRLLQPDMGDSASLYVGSLIHQLLLKMPAQVWLRLLLYCWLSSAWLYQQCRLYK